MITARAASDGAIIEVHVLDRGRWAGIRETASFGVAYETPRSAARLSDCEAVTEAVAQAIRANDSGQLPRVDAIPLQSEPPPPAVSRMLDRVAGARGLAVGACLTGFTWLLASTQGGAWGSALWLALLGFLLRAPSLGVPFAHDQDVQRLFTGHLPMRDVLLGLGLTDRHPPFYFVVLHFTQLFGQSESVVRAPAVIAGALVGPAVVWGAWTLGRRVEIAAIAGLAATVSAELIGRSREVSPIPLFALLAIMATVSLAKHVETPTRTWTAVVAISHGLALWTYYLAPFVLVGNVLVLVAARRLSRPTSRALALGAALGAPALILGIVTFFRDRSARLTADAHPDLAWGQRGIGETAHLLTTLATQALSPALLLAFAAVLLNSARKKDFPALGPAGGLVAAFAGIAMLAPVARVQPYYLVAVLPLVTLCIAVGGESLWPSRRHVPAAALALMVAALSVPGLSSARTLYQPDADAFMPAFAEVVSASGERRVVTVAHYDGTLLAYYMAQRAGVPMDWQLMVPEQDGDGFALAGVDKVVDSLAHSHSLAGDPDSAATEKLSSLLARESVLVVERDGFRLPNLSDRLRRCKRLAEIGTGRLYRCSQQR